VKITALYERKSGDEVKVTFDYLPEENIFITSQTVSPPDGAEVEVTEILDEDGSEVELDDVEWDTITEWAYNYGEEHWKEFVEYDEPDYDDL